MQFCNTTWRSSDDSPGEVYKATKLNAFGDVKTNEKSTGEHNDVDEDVAAGPELPPDEDEEVPADEEGRFFGGGINNNTADVLDFIDERDTDDLVESKIACKRDITWLTQFLEAREN